MLEIRNTELSDLHYIYEFFNHSVRYQETKGYPVWKNYDKNAIIQDVKSKNQYKVVIVANALTIGNFYSPCHFKVMENYLNVLTS